MIPGAFERHVISFSKHSLQQPYNLTVSQNQFSAKRYLVVLNNTDFGRSR